MQASNARTSHPLAARHDGVFPWSVIPPAPHPMAIRGAEAAARR